MAVAAVAVLAVGAGAVLAARQGPADATNTAAPLPGATPTSTRPSTAIAKSSATPAPYSLSAPTPKPAVQVPAVQVKVDLSKLPTGRRPQLSYLTGRVIRGGLGEDVSVPGKQNILRAARVSGDRAYVVLEVGLGGAELVEVGFDASTTQIPDVQSLVSSMDEDSLAFATAPSNPDHTRAKGSAVYWESTQTVGSRRKLDRPDDWGSAVLAVVGETVFFKSDTHPDGLTSTLNSWNSATGKVTRIESVRSPVGVGDSGKLAVDFVAGAAQTFCSTVNELAEGKQLWRTCEYAIAGFTPDGKTAIGTPDFREGGSDPLVAALNSSSGTVLREWTGAQFLEVVAEDDDHLLMVADSGEGTPGGIIRCTIGTGDCEVATPLAKTSRYATRLLGAWG